MALILTIDDEPAIRLSISSYLEDFGHTVIEAEGGIKGLILFKQKKPDLLLIDINMSDLSGLAVLDEVTKKSPETPVIMLSGMGIVGDVVEALRRGAWNYLTKPIADMDVLRHSVNQSLERAKLLRENKAYQLHLENEIAKHTRDLNSLVNNLPIGIYRVKANSNGIICMANPAIANMFDYPSPLKFCQQMNFEQLFADRHEANLLIEQLNHSETLRMYEIEFKRKDGSCFWGAITTYPIYDKDGKEEYIDGAIEDISARKTAETAIQHQAFYDSLTDLPNRALLLERMEHQTMLAKRQKTYASVLFLDLDHFKNLNDALGHSAGDELLKQVASRLRELVRSVDTVARLGGDEFVILLAMQTDEIEHAGLQANHVAENIRLAIAEPFMIFGHSFQLTVSIGVVVFPNKPNESSQDILKYADTAMYSSKKSGRNTIKFFQTHMNEAATFRLEIENELRTAFKHDRYILHYQPLVGQTGNLLGAECLLRLYHSGGHIVPPIQFISVAEEMGLIRDISLWILDQASQQLQHWADSHNLNDEHMAINISARHFYQRDFIPDVKKIISEKKLDPSRFVLEITEGMLLHDINKAIEKMKILKNMGFRFAVDDFGTGYSSLAYLTKLPLDILKIDQSFVMDITTDKDALTIVETIISMAHHLGLEIVAEGIETAAQHQLLHERGCHIFQGYHFSRPVSAEGLMKYLKK